MNDYDVAADLLEEKGFSEIARELRDHSGMIEKYVLLFNIKRESLIKYFADNEPQSYRALLTTVIAEIAGADMLFEQITEVNDGDYQGTLLYLIPEREYQPLTYYYVKISYGGFQYIKHEPVENRPEQYAKLALHIIQNLRKI
jgi:hypothetical protein